MAALYRKWRPKTFDEIKGQEAICTTLKNQIKSGKLSHAYLFCGTRGTGKTSIAKIMAKAVNCESPIDGNPCNVCESCKSISSESALHIVEMDAASNNGVDDIRYIKEQVEYPPSHGRYRVFIIDEVHMLTDAAFNALLKTLEEPPNYVIFILATTEVHKIPITVLSRCQRYDLKRIDIPTISQRLKALCEEENVDIEDEALYYLAKLADGAMRDALSLLDEVIAFSGGEKLTYDSILQILGLADNSVYDKMFLSIIKSDIISAIRVLEDISIQGKDLSVFTKEFLWYLRNLLIIKLEGEEILDIAKENMEIMQQNAESVSKEALMRYIRILSEVLSKLRYSPEKRILLELAILKLLTPQMEEYTDSILERLASLEKKVDTGKIYVSGKRAAIEEKAEEEPETVQTIELEPAQYDDLMLLRKEWSKIIGSIGASLAAIYKDTVVEPVGDGAMKISFFSEALYRLGKKEEYIKEIEASLKQRYAKDFRLEAVLKSDADRNKIQYTKAPSMEFLKSVVDGMEITIEE